MQVRACVPCCSGGGAGGGHRATPTQRNAPCCVRRRCMRPPTAMVACAAHTSSVGQHRIGGRALVPPIAIASLPRRSLIVAAAAASASPPATDREQDPPKPRSFARSAWAFVDVLAIFGSVGGAVCALLGIGTTAYVLALPMVLPVVSLIAALSREGLIAEVGVQTSHAAPCTPMRHAFPDGTHTWHTRTHHHLNRTTPASTTGSAHPSRETPTSCCRTRGRRWRRCGASSRRRPRQRVGCRHWRAG
jgi:hypothetical protein